MEAETRVDVAEAVRLYEDGMTLSEIAKRYGVSRQRVGVMVKDTAGPRRLRCRDCGVHVPGASRGQGQRCCDNCRAKRDYKQLHDKCGCGRTKTKVSEKCARCLRVMDYELLRQLYERGYGIKPIADYFKVLPVSVYQAMKREGIPTRTMSEAWQLRKAGLPPIEQAASELKA